MNKQIEKKCQDCLHYEVCRFVNALAVANVANAENCRMFKDKKGYRKTTDIAREIFEEIEINVIFVKDHTGKLASIVRFADILKLKKKYESEGAE